MRSLTSSGRYCRLRQSAKLFAAVALLGCSPIVLASNDISFATWDCDGGNFTTEYDLAFQRVGQIVGIDGCRLKAQAAQESSLDPDAESPAGAIGIAQFLPSTWDWLIEKYDLPDWSIRDPVDSICMQGLYFTYLLERCERFDGEDRWECALASYNAGEGRVRRVARAVGSVGWSAVKIALPEETVKYSRLITKRLLRLRRGRK